MDDYKPHVMCANTGRSLGVMGAHRRDSQPRLRGSQDFLEEVTFGLNLEKERR
jgi:hypothetical protein